MGELNRWWQKTSIYQVYPRSFLDGNDDGIGDLKGIISKLDYIRDLGFETIWSSPFYRSPHGDHGYDISDFYSIDPDYGTMEDALALIEEVHRRDMKIVFDMVLNHTSVEHPWFRESRSSRDNPKRHWYIWRDGRGKKPPNNWRSMVGNNGWQYDPATGQWYYANFLTFQPDLNWNNPEVKQEMFNVMRYWLDRGVDGFRLDIFNSIYKDELFRDNPFCFRYIPSEDNNDEAYFQKKIHNFNHPKNFALAKEVRALVDLYNGDRMLLGEVSGRHEILKKFFGDDHDGLNLIFMFETVGVKFSAGYFRKVVETYERLYPYPYVPTCVYGNHDVMRVISKVGNDIEKAKCLALFQMTMRGVPVLYNGEEIGMTDTDFGFKDALDPIARQYAHIPRKVADILGVFINRDRCRTPMQWDDGPNAGFCGEGTRPWLPVTPNYRERNVAAEARDPNSLLNAYRALLGLRNSRLVFREGELLLIEEGRLPKDVLMYERSLGEERAAVAVNFGEKEVRFKNPVDCGELVYQTRDGASADGGHIVLPPAAGCVLVN
ncbi:MAG TPA: alpha-glucosidase [Spirochaetes bacterium]|nr:alpha-glucosidase [Spirochaetota bacterium]